MRNFLFDHEIVVVEAAAAAGQTTLTTDAIDMAGWSEVTFIAHLGDVTDTSALDFAVEHSDESGANYAELAGALTHTADASDADNKVLALNAVNPTKRYVRATLARGTANAVVNGIIAIKSGPINAPVTQGATVLDSAILPNPAAA